MRLQMPRARWLMSGRIGEHDWYDEISNQLLKDQNKDGSWGHHEPAVTY